MNKLNRAALVVAISGVALMSQSAEATESDAGLWATLSGQYRLSERVSVQLALQPRFDQNISELERFVVRPAVSVSLLEGLTGTLGYDAHFIEEPPSILEQRFWQQLALSRKWAEFVSTFRFRLEERFVEGIDDTGVRGLFFFRFAHPLLDTGWYAALSDEVFVNLNSISPGSRRGFDQNRFFAGVGHLLGAGVEFEIGYQMQYIERRAPSADAHNHILMVGLSISLPE